MKIGDRFTSRMHESLFKPEGFKKKARTFSRFHPAYGECYNLQGSAWNSPDAPWRFYVNCGISFPDIPLEQTGSGMWAFHAHTRLGVFAPDSPPEFDVTDENFEQLASDLTGYLKQCFSYFSRRHEFLRASFVQRKYHLSFLYDPELQRG
jgi:hypothetical protein